MKEMIFEDIMVKIMIKKIKKKGIKEIMFLIVFKVVELLMMVGGWLGIKYVEKKIWGGILVKMVI